MDRTERKRAPSSSRNGFIGSAATVPARSAVMAPKTHRHGSSASDSRQDRESSGGPLPRSWYTVLSYLLGALVALPLLLPVLENIEEGRRLVELGVLSPRDRLRPVGLGPVSGLMLYLIATPVLVGISRRFSSQLAVIAGMALLALTVSHLTSLFEQGRPLAGLGLSALTIAALVGLGGAIWWQRRARRLHRERIAGMLATLTRQVAAASHVVSAQDPHGDVVAMVERMVLSALWEAAQGDREPPFETRVALAMADIRRDLARNRTLDPSGAGTAMMDRLLPRIRDSLAASQRKGRAAR